MKIGKLLQSEIVSDRAAIQIYKTYKSPRRTRNALEAEGFKDEQSILQFADTELTEFYYKEYPNIITIYI